MEDSPPTSIILVLGAGLDSKDVPSDILKDRLITAVEYTRRNKPEKIIVSGGNSSFGMNEARVMAAFLAEHGISNDRIIMDLHGRSTFHSLVNLRNNIQHGQPITVISQRFHLTRVLFLSRSLGIECLGLFAQNLTFSKTKIALWTLREMLALPFNFIKLINYYLRAYFYKS